MNVVLVEPEIPPNTGNIARLCAGTNTTLHLIKPLGFKIDDYHLRRAGLDYWDNVDLKIWESFEEFQKATTDKRKWYFTTKTDKKYTDVTYQKGDYFIFGKETKGLPEDVLKANQDNVLTIPINKTHIRSLNLSNSVAIVLYEVLRQNNFNIV
jgi:tRNA (cytidine/uridine-2'-O-)-methyltransferase